MPSQCPDDFVYSWPSKRCGCARIIESCPYCCGSYSACPSCPHCHGQAYIESSCPHSRGGMTENSGVSAAAMPSAALLSPWDVAAAASLSSGSHRRSRTPGSVTSTERGAPGSPSSNRAYDEGRSGDSSSLLSSPSPTSQSSSSSSFSTSSSSSSRKRSQYASQSKKAAGRSRSKDRGNGGLGRSSGSRR